MMLRGTRYSHGSLTDPLDTPTAYLACSRFGKKWWKSVWPRTLQSVPMEAFFDRSLIQGADTVACGSTCGLTAETLIDAQDCRRCERKFLEHWIDKRPVGTILSARLLIATCMRRAVWSNSKGKYRRWRPDGHSENPLLTWSLKLKTRGPPR